MRDSAGDEYVILYRPDYEAIILQLKTACLYTGGTPEACQAPGATRPE